MNARVLVVDDSASFRAAATELLNAEGFEVVGVAADGAQAVDQVRRTRPDIVVLDIALPDVTGFTVAEEIARGPGAPNVVLVSSRDWSDLAARVRACGACGFVPKDELTAAAVAGLTAGTT